MRRLLVRSFERLPLVRHLYACPPVGVGSIWALVFAQMRSQVSNTQFILSAAAERASELRIASLVADDGDARRAAHSPPTAASVTWRAPCDSELAWRGRFRVRPIVLVRRLCATSNN